MQDRQRLLFEPTPDMRPNASVLPPVKTLSHAGDPVTSHEAAEQHDASGKRVGNAVLVLRLVERLPRLTACELWEECTAAERMQLVEMQEIRRRLDDLHKAGKVWQLPKRVCWVRGSSQVTWEAAAEFRDKQPEAPTK
jgi:hypothetical protein